MALSVKLTIVIEVVRPEFLSSRGWLLIRLLIDPKEPLIFFKGMLGLCRRGSHLDRGICLGLLFCSVAHGRIFHLGLSQGGKAKKGVNRLHLRLLKDCPLRSFVMLTPHGPTELVVLVPLLITHYFGLNEARVIRLCLIRCWVTSEPSSGVKPWR